MSSSIITGIENDYLKADIPEFSAGDTVVVRVRIKEGEKERIQAFEGTVLRKRGGKGLKGTFTVRKISSGIGVERIFPLHSPSIESVTVKTEGLVRRSRIYYLRDLRGKKARLKKKSDIRR